MKIECNILSPIIRFFLGRDVKFFDCCADHDQLYAEAGTSIDRLKADIRLRECVTSHGYPMTAWMMYYAVRLFGWRHWGDK